MATRRKRRFGALGMSLLDIMTCGFAAMLLLFIIQKSSLETNLKLIEDDKEVNLSIENALLSQISEDQIRYAEAGDSTGPKEAFFLIDSAIEGKETTRTYSAFSDFIKDSKYQRFSFLFVGDRFEYVPPVSEMSKAEFEKHRANAGLEPATSFDVLAAINEVKQLTNGRVDTDLVFVTDELYIPDPKNTNLDPITEDISRQLSDVLSVGYQIKSQIITYHLFDANECGRIEERFLERYKKFGEEGKYNSYSNSKKIVDPIYVADFWLRLMNRHGGIARFYNYDLQQGCRDD